MTPDELLGRRVRVFDGQRADVRAEGEVVGIILEPTLAIRLDDGTRAYESSGLPLEVERREWEPARLTIR